MSTRITLAVNPDFRLSEECLDESGDVYLTIPTENIDITLDINAANPKYPGKLEIRIPKKIWNEIIQIGERR